MVIIIHEVSHKIVQFQYTIFCEKVTNQCIKLIDIITLKIMNIQKNQIREWFLKEILE